MQVTFDLPQEKVDILVHAFSPSRFENQQELLDELLPMMADAWIDWVSGARRYRSQTEQYVDWVEQLYNQVLPLDEPPSADRLFNSFNIPFGQAQYIARVLNNRSQVHWRESALTKLKEMLSEKKVEAENMLAHEAGDQTIELLLYRPSFQELEFAIEELFRADSSTVDIPKITSTHNLYAVRVTARTLIAVCGSFNL